jgi:tetratricopeptide (TPR) repeat protein
VALVTVVVYEGYVEVGGGGERTQIAQGSIVEVRAGKVTKLEDKRDELIADLDKRMAELEKIESDIADREAAIAAREAAVAELEKAVGGPGTPTPANCDAAALAQRAGDEAILGNHAAALSYYQRSLACKPDTSTRRKAYLAACKSHAWPQARSLFVQLGNPDNLAQLCLREGYDPRTEPANDRLDRAIITAAMDPIRDRILACSDGSFDGTVKATVKVAPDGSVSSVAITPATVAFASCMRGVISGTTFAATTSGGAFSYPYAMKSATTPARCDKTTTETIEQRGDELVARGSYAAALATYRKASDCDMRITRKAYLAACNIRDRVAAKQLFFQLGSPAVLVQVCLRNGFDPREGTGKLRVTSAPYSLVWVDGAEKSKRATPAVFDLAPGKHKLTFLRAGDKFTYTVEVKEGETTVMHKDLP